MKESESKQSDAPDYGPVARAVVHTDSVPNSISANIRSIADSGRTQPYLSVEPIDRFDTRTCIRKDASGTLVTDRCGEDMPSTLMKLAESNGGDIAYVACHYSRLGFLSDIEIDNDNLAILVNPNRMIAQEAYRMVFGMLPHLTYKSHISMGDKVAGVEKHVGQEYDQLAVMTDEEFPIACAQALEQLFIYGLQHLNDIMPDTSPIPASPKKLLHHFMYGMKGHLELEARKRKNKRYNLRTRTKLEAQTQFLFFNEPALQDLMVMKSI
jgi:hypothetical protein